MQPRHVIVLLDIDQTVANTTLSTQLEAFRYTGNRNVWYDNLKKLRDEAAANNIHIHFGIATSKKTEPVAKHWFALWKQNTWIDWLSAHILGINILSPNPLLFPVKTQEQLNKSSLKEFLETELCYFIGDEIQKKMAEHLCAEDKLNAKQISEEEFKLIEDAFKKNAFEMKAKLALQMAKDHLQQKFSTSIPNADVFLIDDNIEYCNAATELGFQAICVGTQLVTCGNTGAQEAVINYIFQTILKNYILTPQNTETVTNVSENATTWNKSIDAIFEKSFTARLAGVRDAFFQQASISASASIASVSASAVSPTGLRN